VYSLQLLAELKRTLKRVLAYSKACTQERVL
jgi:hypothetical protein